MSPESAQRLRAIAVDPQAPRSSRVAAWSAYLTWLGHTTGA